MARDNSRKVAVLLPNLAGGGAERVTLTLVTDLIERGHRVDLLLLQTVGELLPLLPKRVQVIDLDARRIIAALGPLVRYLRENRPETVHAVMWPLTIVAVMAHRLARSSARLVLSDHTMLSRHARTDRQRRLLEWTTRLFYPLADARTMCSKAAADDLAELSGLERDRIDVIYNPVQAPARIAPSAEAEAAWGGSSPRIITVGSLKAVKNHALLIDAFARLENCDALLMILGQGDLQPALERQAARLGIAERVIFSGFTTNPWPYYASADLFVLTSDYEGFGNVLIEAMHAGLKIVSTDSPGGPSEILDGGRYGQLVPCGDVEVLAEAIEQALDQPKTPERMRARANEISGAQTLDRFRELLIA